MANHRATLFVMAKGLPPPLGEGDEPPGSSRRRRYPLYAHAHGCHPDKGAMPAAAISTLETQSGGIAHVRIGDHLLDIYAQQGATVVHIPALGIPLRRLLGATRWPRWPTAATAARNWTAAPAQRLQCATGVQLFIPHVGR